MGTYWAHRGYLLLLPYVQASQGKGLLPSLPEDVAIAHVSKSGLTVLNLGHMASLDICGLLIGTLGLTQASLGLL